MDYTTQAREKQDRGRKSRERQERGNPEGTEGQERGKRKTREKKIPSSLVNFALILSQHSQMRLKFTHIWRGKRS